MSNVSHRFVKTNGINMHIAEQGVGPLVILCHGFPEGWYSWRHQLPAIAEAGFHAVAPDQRGYGQTDQPESIEDYDIFQLTGDIVGLVHTLGEEQAVVIGHDWGAPVAWHCALLRQDMFRAVGLFSIPYVPRTWDDLRPTDAMRLMAGDYEFYQLYFQEPGKAEKDLEEDVDRTIRMMMYSGSGDAPPEKRWRFIFNKSERLTDIGFVPDTLPDWLTEQDIEYMVGEYKRTGFRGGVNWYRNIDRMWELTPFLSRAKLYQPAMFVAGEVDTIVAIYGGVLDTLEQGIPNLRKKVLIEGAGHWVQQECPAEVNNHIIEFL
ncbi:MAG: alpha/beta hydrolase, partial [Chloroflexota bacterium]|nr:alpha/beta hydrolase [Chloroflexota bacterium]